jgi:hypothetical protein
MASASARTAVWATGTTERGRFCGRISGSNREKCGFLGMAVEKSDIMVVRYFREARVFTRRLCKPPPQPHTCGRSLTDTDRPSFCRRSLQNDPRLHELGDQEVAMAAAATLSDIKDLKDAAYFRRQAKRTTAMAQTILSRMCAKHGRISLARTKNWPMILIGDPSGSAIQSCYRRGYFRRA